MVAGELIALLEAAPQNAEVWADGCDCSNPVKGVELLESGMVVVLVDAGEREGL